MTVSVDLADSEAALVGADSAEAASVEGEGLVVLEADSPEVEALREVFKRRGYG